MAAVERVLIVGAGIGGLSYGDCVARAGIAVDIVELETRVLGLGITLTGTTLRALDMVGLADGCRRAGIRLRFLPDQRWRRQIAGQEPAAACPSGLARRSRN